MYVNYIITLGFMSLTCCTIKHGKELSVHSTQDELKRLRILNLHSSIIINLLQHSKVYRN